MQALDAVPDLVIADYRLPMSGTGIDVIRDARKLTGAWIPGIILTGDISPQILHEAGAHHLAVIHKPAAPDELLALINKMLASVR